MSRGRFIVLEGLDGAGTTTQCERLGKALRTAKRRVLLTREPSDGPIGTLLRQAMTGRVALPDGHGPLTPATLALLFAADRVDHLAADIEPALKRGTWVLSDRYLLSSLAYQALDNPMKWISEINRWSRTPDLTLFVDVSAATAAKRRGGRGGRAELFENDGLQRRTRRLYQKAITIRRRAGERIAVIDGSQPVDAVTQAALLAIAQAL
jgi:dTMP kinase